MKSPWGRLRERRPPTPLEGSGVIGPPEPAGLGWPRPTATGMAGGGAWLALGVGWVALTGPPWPGVLVGWFVLLALAGSLLPGLANQVTIVRAYLAGVVFTYALTPAGLGGLTVAVALGAASDVADGHVARHFQRPTRLGGALDPVVDGLFFGAAAAGLALGGAYPAWLAAVVIARYAAPAVAGTILLLIGRRPLLRHSLLGQLSTLLIAVLLGAVTLVRGLRGDPSWLVLVAEVVIPVSAAAAWANLAWANRAALRSSNGPMSG
jgi:cardiolipin synthase (CMP-forming)